jgi:hypothetical protein
MEVRAIETRFPFGLPVARQFTLGLKLKLFVRFWPAAGLY